MAESDFNRAAGTPRDVLERGDWLVNSVAAKADVLFVVAGQRVLDELDQGTACVLLDELRETTKELQAVFQQLREAL